MFSFFAKTLLILTAVAPVGLVYAWVAARSGHERVAFGLLLAAGLLMFVCRILLKAAKENLEKIEFKPVTVEAADRENIAFMLLYLSPLFSSAVGDINFDVIIPTIIVFMVMSATGYTYHFNPLLGLMGWHFYKVSSSAGVSYVLVTRKQLRRANDVAIVGQLTEYILIDLEG